MGHQDHQNLYGIARTDSDRRLADFNAFEQQRDQLAQTERQVQQRDEANRLLREQNELLAQQAATMDGLADATDPIAITDASADERFWRGQEWEAEARYRCDSDYRAAYDAVMADAGLHLAGFDSRAIHRYGYLIHSTYIAVQTYRQDSKYRSAYEAVMHKQRLSSGFDACQLYRFRAAIDARRRSLVGRIWG